MTELVESHFVAALLASSAACEILEILPENDLVLELKNLMEIQYDLFCHIIEGKHYGTDNLQYFIEYAEDISHQVIRIREAK